MEKKKVPVMFQKLETFEQEDKRFIKVKIWLLHLGKNFNGSFFSKEVVVNALPTLANNPILATIVDGDFEEHNTDVVLDGTTGEYKEVSTSSVIGVIPESCNPQFEMRTTDSGEEREYLTVEALVWAKLTEFSDLLVEKEISNQSMEITDLNGTMREDGYFEFSEFKFYGACVLGDKYAPAMENSTIEVNFSSKVNMNIIEEKLQQFNALFSKEGGNAMTVEKVEEVLEVTPEVTPEPEVVVEPEVTPEAAPEPETAKTEEEPEVKEEETPEVEPKPEEEPEEEPKAEFARITGNFAIGNSEVKRLLKEAVSKFTYDDYGYESRKYYVKDFTADYIIVEDYKDNYSIKAIPYTINGAEVTVSEESKQNVHMEYVISGADAPAFVFVDAEEKAKMIKDLEELETLREFKRKAEEAELASMFNSQLPESELAEVFAQSKDKDLEEVQKELFALVGKKNFAMQSGTTKSKVEPIQIQIDKQAKTEDIKNEPYGGLFKKFL